jgi:hypothetical protein
VTIGLDGLALSHSPGRIAPAHPAFADSRKPLAGEFVFNGRKVFVVAAHFKSKVDDDPLFGVNQPPVPATEAQRLAQAQVVNGFVGAILARDAGANVVVLGDLNDFGFAPPLVALAGSLLTNLTDGLAEGERYSYVFDGNSQQLDHILVSGALAAGAAPEVDIVHAVAEFPAAGRATDHDPVLARLHLPPPAVGFAAPSFNVLEGAPSAAITVTLSFAAALTVTVDLATANGTALAGSDYVTVARTLTFAPGVTVTMATVPLMDDGVGEADETVLLSLGNPTGAVLGPVAATTLAIRDDDGGPPPPVYRMYVPAVRR